MALNTVSSDRLSTNVKNTNFTSAEKQDLTNDILPLAGQLGNRNKIINGSMICSQRASSLACTGSTNAYVALDRFKFLNAHDGASTVSQSSTSPDGFSNSLKVDVTTADTSLAASQFSSLSQRIEAQDLQDLGFGTSGAKTITVSFYVRSNKTGNYAFAIQQADNSYKQVSQTYTINSADTWERKTFSFAGDTSGVINNDNGSGLELYWWLAAGTTYTTGSSRSAWTAYSNPDAAAGQTVNLFDSTSNEWYITGVQLEVGSVATDFEHRSLADELQRCLRYFYQITKIGSTSEVTNKPIGPGMYYTASDYRCHIEFPVEMRAVPTFESNDNSNSFYIHYNANADFIDKMIGFNHTKKRATIRNNVNTSGTQGYPGFLNQETGDSNLSFSAEL